MNFLNYIFENLVISCGFQDFNLALVKFYYQFF